MPDLLNKIARVDKKGGIRIKKISEEEFKRMNSWKRKSWSTRSRRWLKMMPHEILEGNPWEKGTKTRVKEWVKDNVRRRGLDSILWGRWEQCEEEEEGEKETVRKTGVESPKSRNPPTSRKQLRKLGEPRRKICKVAEQQMAEDSNSERGNLPLGPRQGRMDLT